MQNVFETIAEAINPEVAKLELELLLTEQKIKKLTPHDSYLDAVSRAFPYGVGGSGKNVKGLNKRRERYLDKTIEVAKQLTPLYEKRDNLIKRIEDIKSGKAAKREESIIDKRLKLAVMWRGLKAGDELPIGNSNGNPIIKTKNRLSAITEGGVKWTASEVIGKQAARFI